MREGRREGIREREGIRWTMRMGRGNRKRWLLRKLKVGRKSGNQIKQKHSNPASTTPTNKTSQSINPPTNHNHNLQAHQSPNRIPCANPKYPNRNLKTLPAKKPSPQTQNNPSSDHKAATANVTTTHPTFPSTQNTQFSRSSNQRIKSYCRSVRKWRKKYRS
jgi:hypothetical protein